MLVIGSVAAKYWLPNFREPADVDIWMHHNELETFYNANKNDIQKFTPQFNPRKFSLIIAGRKVELGLYKKYSPEYYIELAQSHFKTIRLFNCDFKVASLKSLLLIKKSHIHFPINWLKHIEDYTRIKESIKDSRVVFGWQNEAMLEDAFKVMYVAIQERFKKRKSKLNISNDEFFNRSQMSVGRKYIHDDIHRAVSFYYSPMYLKLKNNQSLAWCDKTLWDKLSHADKVKAVQEEAFVIALERYIIPTHENFNSIGPTMTYNAFTRALSRIGTTLTSGWFRDFLIENWRECSRLEVDYVEKFDIALKRGEVKSYE